MKQPFTVRKSTQQYSPVKLTPHGEASFLDLLQATFGQDSLCNFNQFQSLLGFKHSHGAFHNLALPESMMKTRKP